MKARRQGFTLIELMVVVIIIAALAGMVLPRLMPASDAAKRRIARHDIANIELALKLFRLHMNRYPTTEEGLAILIVPPAASKDWTEPFLDRLPMDPWGHPYRYRRPGTRDNAPFDVWSVGPDGRDGTEDDVTSRHEE